VLGSENLNILIHVTEGERVMYNVYMMSTYVIVHHQGSYGRDLLGEEKVWYQSP
jgi:hypothetical protein